MTRKYTPEERIEAFWSKVDRTGGDDACWEWMASKKADGYGWFRWERGMRLAHRVACHLTYGDIPDGLHVCHACDNPACCNPAHLWLGTNAENVKDKMRKGRHKNGDQRGEKHSRAKLTWSQVREIRRRYAAGGIMQKELAKEFNVGHAAISDIVNYKKWLPNFGGKAA
jgi:hypothetical protein